MPSKLWSFGVDAEKICDPDPKRKQVIVLNQDTGDEVLRVSESQSDVADSAITAYNRGHAIIEGEMAKGALWVISDTATTAGTVTQVY